MKYKIGDRVKSESLGPALIKDIYKSITNEDFVYLISPLDDLEKYFFVLEDDMKNRINSKYEP